MPAMQESQAQAKSHLRRQPLYRCLGHELGGRERLSLTRYPEDELIQGHSGSRDYRVEHPITVRPTAIHVLRPVRLVTPGLDQVARVSGS